MTPAPASPIVTHRDALDVQLIVTFTPSAPLGLITVEIDGEEEPSHARYLHLLEAAVERLTVYAQDYQGAAEADIDAGTDEEGAR